MGRWVEWDVLVEVYMSVGERELVRVKRGRGGGGSECVSLFERQGRWGRGKGPYKWATWERREGRGGQALGTRLANETGEG